MALYAVLIYLLAFELVPALLGRPDVDETARVLEAHSIARRVELWWIAIGMMADAPVLGVGPGHFAYWFNLAAAHPHNLWLQLCAEWGVPATLFLAAAVIVGFRRLLLAACERSDISCVLAASVALTIGAMFDGFFVIPTSQLAATIVAALACSCMAYKSGPKPSMLTRPLEVVCATLAVAVFATLVLLPFSSMGSPQSREAAWRAEHPNDILRPRFWAQGWIGPDQDPTAR